MSKYKSVNRESELQDCLDLTDIEELKDEMEDWVSNMSGTGLENTNKYSMAEEAASTLENAESINFDEIWECIPAEEQEKLKTTKITYSEFVPRAKRQSTSRSTRLSNIIGRVRAGLEYLQNLVDEQDPAAPEKYPGLEDVLNGIDSEISDLENVDFPTMFS